MTAYYFEVNDYKKGKPITINDVSGREFLFDKDKYSRGYLMYKDGMIYLALAVTARKKDTSAENNTNRFLHSYVIHHPDAQTAETKYITYTNPLKAFRIELPAQPQPINELPNKGKDSTIITNLQTVVDPKSGAYLFFGTNEATPGYFLENDSVMLAGLKESQRSKLSNFSIDTMYLLNGHRVMELGGMMKAAAMMLKTHYEFRGNRWYALGALYNPKKEAPAVGRFFQSFQLLDFPSSEWKTSSAGDNLFSTWTPGQIKEAPLKSSDSDISMRKYDSYDSAQANGYTILSETFGKYYWQSSDSVLLEKLARNKVEHNDSVLLKRWVNNGGVTGIEMQIKQKGSMNAKRKRLFINDNKLFTLVTILPASDINSSNNNRFFEDFTFTKKLSSTQLFTSKSTLLLSDISNPDSSVRAAAKDAISTAPFTKEDLPALQKAMLKEYDDDKEEYGNTKSVLQKAIEKLHDSSSYHFAKEQYLQTTGNDKNRMLDIMLFYPTQEHFNEIKSLLLQQPPTQKLGYTFTSRFKDSLPLTASVFPDLLPLLSDTVLSPALVEIARTLLDSGYIRPSLLQEYKQPIVALAQQYYNRLKMNPDDYNYYNYSLLDVLGYINNPSADAALQSFASLKGSPYLQLQAAAYLLKNKQVIKPSVWQNLAAERGTRTRLYDTLKAYNKAAFLILKNTLHNNILPKALYMLWFLMTTSLLHLLILPRK